MHGSGSFGWDSFKGKIIQALLPRDKEFDSASQMQPLGYMNKLSEDVYKTEKEIRVTCM